MRVKSIAKLSGLILLCFSNQTFAQESRLDQYYSGQFKQLIHATALAIGEGETSFENFQLKALSEMQLGQSDQAVATLQQALEIYPGDARIKRMLASQYFESGAYVEALQLYSGLVETDSTDQSGWLKLAEIYSFRQLYPQAIHALEQVLVIDSLNLNSLMMLGDILNRHNNSGAVVYYRRAFRLYPSNQKAAYALSNWYIQSKDSWMAIPICDQILEKDSSNIRFRKLKAYALYKMGDPGPALKQFQIAVDDGDSTTFTFKFKGICHYLMVDFPGAIESLELAAQKDSTDAEVHFFLGASLATTTRKTEAMYHLNRSLQLMQPDPSIVSRIYSEQGNLKRLESEYETAYELYKKAWMADTTNALPVYFMASIRDNSLHESRAALVDYQKYLQILDNMPETNEPSNQVISIRAIVEDRINSLKEELFFLDQDR